jgi:hypothetical protein
MNGTGKLIFTEKDKKNEFFGEFSNNQMVHGELIYKTGTKYVGEIKNGKFHGKGSIKTPDREIEGEF